MSKLVTNFYLDIYRALTDLEKVPRNVGNVTNRQSLIALLKKELRNYDSEIWEKSEEPYGSLATIFNIISKIYDDIYFRLAYFLVLSFYKNERFKINQIYLCTITSALLKNNVNPNNYKKYCDILLADAILRQFSPYDWNAIEYYILHFVKRVPFELIAFKNIEGAHKFLCEMMRIPYSPILYGNFSLLNTFTTVLRLMKRFQAEENIFSTDDFVNLKNLKFFDIELSPEEKREFERKISELEDSYGYNPKVFIDRLLKMITIEKAKMRGIAIIPKPIKKEE